MPRSPELIAALEDAIKANFDFCNWYMQNSYRGGWEVWLQTTYVKAVFDRLQNTQDTVTDFDREVPYTNQSGKKCDLWFQAKKGAAIWVELKAQRNRNYNTSLSNDFMTDVGKIKANAGADVGIAAAVFLMSENDAKSGLDFTGSNYKIRYLDGSRNWQLIRSPTDFFGKNGSLTLATYTNSF